MISKPKTEGVLTIIQCYRRHGRFISIPSYLAALLLFLANIFVHNRIAQLVVASFAAALMIGAFIATTRFSCPRCRKPMGLVSKAPISRSMVGKPVVCRHCGVNVEEPC